MLDEATQRAFQLVTRTAECRPLKGADHRLLKELARRAPEGARSEHWPEIWSRFAESFDPQ